jgi:hypothetical protein
LPEKRCFQLDIMAFVPKFYVKVLSK